MEPSVFRVWVLNVDLLRDAGYCKVFTVVSVFVLFWCNWTNILCFVSSRLWFERQCKRNASSKAFLYSSTAYVHVNNRSSHNNKYRLYDIIPMRCRVSIDRRTSDWRSALDTARSGSRQNNVTTWTKIFRSTCSRASLCLRSRPCFHLAEPRLSKTKQSKVRMGTLSPN